MRQAARCFGDAAREIRDTLLDANAPVAAGVRDQVLGADGGGTLELTAEGEDGFRADDRVGRGHIDEVVVVDDERMEVELLARVCEQLAIGHRGRTGAPHAWARREDLEGVRAQFVGFERGLFERALTCGVESEAQIFMVAVTADVGSRMLDLGW